MSWRTVNLGELVDNFSVRAKDHDSDTSELVFYGVSNEEGITKSKYAAEDKAEDYKIIEKDCFAYNPYRINVGSIGLQEDVTVGLISPAYVVFKPKPRSIIPQLLLKFLKSAEGLRQIKLYARGTVRQALRFEDLCKIELAIPDYEEQLDFFKRIEETEIESKEISTELTHQLDLVKQLRQAFLREAMQGKLVPQEPNDLPANPQNKFFVYVLECSDGSWYKGFTTDIIKRWKEHITGKGAEHTKKFPPVKLIHWEEYETEKEAVNREKFLKSGHGRDWLKQKEKLDQLRQAGEPASVLLEKIKAEKDKWIKEKVIKKPKPIPPILDYEIPFDIPKNWTWCRLGEFAYVTSGSTPKSSAFVPEGIPFLKMYNLREQKIDFDYKQQFIKEEVHNGALKRCRAFPGDLIMNIVGPPLGKLAIIPDSLPECNFNQAAVLIRPTILEMNKYLFWYLSEMSEINEVETKGVAGQNNISVTQAHNMKIPLPPLSEQHRIVAKLDELMTYCDELEASIKESQQQNELLLQQVLREALEPASVNKAEYELNMAAEPKSGYGNS